MIICMVLTESFRLNYQKTKAIIIFIIKALHVIIQNDYYLYSISQCQKKNHHKLQKWSLSFRFQCNIFLSNKRRSKVCSK